MGLFHSLFGRKQEDGPRLKYDPFEQNDASKCKNGKPPSPPEPEVKDRMETLIRIKNEAIAGETTRRDLSRFGLTPEVQKAVQVLLAESARKGENPRHCKVKNVLPDDFVWQEYAEWLEKFKTTKESWPDFWEEAENLHKGIETPLPDLHYHLGRMTKGKLIEIAANSQIELPPKATIKIITEILLSDIYVNKLTPTLDGLNAHYKDSRKNAVVEEKKELFQMALLAESCETERLTEWKKSGVKTVELIPAPDCCSFCRKMAKVYPIDDAPIAGKGRHPGCRCSYTPRS